MLGIALDLTTLTRASYLAELHGDLEAALGAMRQAVGAPSLAPENAAYVGALLGNLLVYSGDPSGAASAYRDALAMVPAHPPSLAGEARLAIGAGNLDEAIDLYQRAADVVPLPEYVIGLAESQMAAGRTDDATRNFKLARAEIDLFKATGVIVDLDLALFEADHGDPAKALEYAEAAYHTAPTVRAADALAWALHRLGRDAEARTRSDEALRLGSVDPLFRYHSGCDRRRARRCKGRSRGPDAGPGTDPGFSATGAAEARRILAVAGARSGPDSSGTVAACAPPRETPWRESRQAEGRPQAEGPALPTLAHMEGPVSRRAMAAGIAGALSIATTSVGGVFASSHREAPLIAGDPGADNTDLYAFVSPDDPNSLTIIANYIPLEDPAGGPNFFPFDPDVRYEIYVDNSGDGKADVSYYFTFKTTRTAKNFAGIPTFLFNDGPITSLNDPNQLAKQTYDVYRNDKKIAAGVRTPPPNIGPRSTPIRRTSRPRPSRRWATAPCSSPGSETTRSSSTSARSSTLAGCDRSTRHMPSRSPTDTGHDGVSGFNTNSIAIKVPLQNLTRDHALPTGPNDPEAVLGVWAAASRKQNRTIRNDGTIKTNGPWKQVSRLGNPLINEVVIPTVKKDYWNSQKPDKDSQFATYYLNPELTAVADYLYSAALPDQAATSNRGDLVAILLTGLNIPDSAVVPGGLQYTGPARSRPTCSG